LLSKQKSNIFGAALCALSRLLPYAKALVHHGGIGTVSQAFAAATPQLITPFAHDQFDNAARVERLGCGFQIHSSGSAQNMQASLKCLLEDESIQQNCAAIRSKVDTGEVSCRKAMTALESIAAGALPSIALSNPGNGSLG
jgi:rhamnosyltransferase subunit B